MFVSVFSSSGEDSLSSELLVRRCTVPEVRVEVDWTDGCFRGADTLLTSHSVTRVKPTCFLKTHTVCVHPAVPQRLCCITGSPDQTVCQTCRRTHTSEIWSVCGLSQTIRPERSTSVIASTQLTNHSRRCQPVSKRVKVSDKSSEDWRADLIRNSSIPLTSFCQRESLLRFYERVLKAAAEEKVKRSLKPGFILIDFIYWAR